MRGLRAAGAAAAVAAAAPLAVAGGRVGTTSGMRVAALITLLLAACALLALVAPAVGFRSSELFILLGMGAFYAVGFTALVAAADHEVRSGQWVDGTVQAVECRSADSGCIWTYHVTDASTEEDFGWIACDDARLAVGERTRVHVDPGRRFHAGLEACAYTSPAWTTTLHLILAAYGLAAAVTFVASLAATRPRTYW